MAIICTVAIAMTAVSLTSAQPAMPAHQQYRDSFPEGVRGFVSMDWREKRKTLDNLIAQGKAALPALISGLQTSQKLDKDAKVPVPLREVGRHCAIAMGQIGDSSVVPVLIEALHHPDRDTQREVIIALAKLGDKRAIDPIVALWADPKEDRTNKRQAAIALASFGKEAVSAIASAKIRGDQDRLATASLLRIAIRDETAVSTFALDKPGTIAARRCEKALEELRRRQADHQPWGVAEIERKADEFETNSQFRSALELWEGIIDSGLYSPKEDEQAREAMLRIKQKAGDDLFKKPVATWKNKVFILAKYDGDLPGQGADKPRHVNYSLSDKEIENIR